MGTAEKIKSFTQLETWKEGHRLVIDIYQITRGFPKEEVFGLTSQLRRAAVSITSNVAEGFSRNSAKDKSQFYCIALGSLTEIQNQLLVAKDIGYIPLTKFQELAKRTVTVSKLMNGLIKSAQDRVLNT